MCFDEKTSLTTFVVGTIANSALLYKTKNIAFVALWQFILLIQLFEAMLWRARSRVNIAACQRASTMIMAHEMSQPLVFLLLAGMLAGKFNTAIVAVAVMYVLFLLYNVDKLHTGCIGPTAECPHIQYPWTKWMDPTFKILYTAAVIVSVLTVPATIPIVYLGVTWAISRFIYPCGFASIWCWFAALGPVVSLFL